MIRARIRYRFLAATVFAVMALQSPAGINTRQTRRLAENPLRRQARADVSRDYGNLPLAFEPNVGQTDAQVRFLARGGGMTALAPPTSPEPRFRPTSPPSRHTRRYSGEVPTFS
jgi:hypothetical protein